MVDPTVEECETAAQRYRLARRAGARRMSTRRLAAAAARAGDPCRQRAAAGNARVYTDEWWPDCLVLLDAAPSAADALPGGTGERRRRGGRGRGRRVTAG